jgi:hypothetical protein
MTFIQKQPGLTLSELELVYDELAIAIDQAGEKNAKIMLVKLALLNAQCMGDAAVFFEHIRQASLDLY